MKCPRCNGTGEVTNPGPMRRMRVKSGLSLRSVARQLGITAGYLSDLERGRRVWTVKLEKEFSEICN